jgi:sulfite reductase (ferredoxin)
VHLGGGLGLDPRFGKKLRAHKVTSSGLDDYVSNVVSAYLEQREDDETFAAWVVRAEDAALRGELGNRTLEPVS